MNETNWLETRLKSWEPRRPSAKIERRLFRSRARARRSELRWALGWLAPVCACLLVAITALKQESGRPYAGSDPVLAMLLSNQVRTGRLAGANTLIQENTVPVTFDWTNRGDLASNVGFMSLSHVTN